MANRGRPAFINRDYTKDAYVQKWLTGSAENTKKGYVKNFPEWLDFIQMSPTEQIQKRMKDITSENVTERCFFEENG